MVHLFYFINRRKVQLKLLLLFIFVGRVIQQNRVGLVFITPGAARLLVIRLQAFGQILMYHKTHVGLIYSHPEGIGSHNYTATVMEPVILFFGALINIQACVVKIGLYAVLIQKFSYFSGFFATAHIHNTTAFYAIGHIQQFTQLVFLVLHHIANAFTLKAFQEYIRPFKQQLLLYIVPNF